MSNQELLSQLKIKINRSHTWVDAVDDSLFRVVLVDVGYGMTPYSCRNLVLKTLIRSEDYRNGHEWYLPDFQLMKIKNLIAPEKLPSQLTNAEVERIIKEASHGKISLLLRSR